MKFQLRIVNDNETLFNMTKGFDLISKEVLQLPCSVEGLCIVFSMNTKTSYNGYVQPFHALFQEGVNVEITSEIPNSVVYAIRFKQLES